MFNSLKAQDLPSDADIASMNVGLEELEVRVDTLFDEAHEASEQEEVDLLAGTEALHYEISTLQYMRDYVQQHNSVPHDVVHLMHQQDPDVVTYFPSLFSALQANEDIDTTAITQEIDSALEALKGASYKTINNSLNAAKKASRGRVKSAASLAAGVAAIVGIVYAVRKIAEYVNRNKIPTYDELREVLDTVYSSTDDIISFGRDVIDKKLYERRDDVFKRADEFLKKHGDTLNISMDTKGNRIIYLDVYKTVRNTTLGEAGYDAKAFNDIKEKVKTINTDIDKKSSKILALLSELDSVSQTALNNLNITDAESNVVYQNMYIVSEIMNAFMMQSGKALKDAEHYIKRMSKMAERDANQAS